MSENTHETNGQATEKKTKKPKANRGPWQSVEEAQQNKPAGADKAKLFRVTTPDGSVSFCWTAYPNDAIVLLAKKAGYAASEHGKQVSKEKVGSLLAALSPEDRAILIAQYVPATTGKKK